MRYRLDVQTVLRLLNTQRPIDRRIRGANRRALVRNPFKLIVLALHRLL